MSAASPVLCWLFDTPPTRALSFGHLKPEPIMIGTLKCWRKGSRTFSQSALRLAIWLSLGMFLKPYLSAVALLVNSSSEKCSVSCIMKVEGL